MKKERLSYEDRLLIDQLLKLNYKLKNIAQAVDKEPSTISREIKNRRLSNNSIEICEKQKDFHLFMEIVKRNIIVIRRNIIIIIKKHKKIILENLNILELV